MQPIILASASAQRKNLLKLTRVPFRIKVSHCKELNRIRTNCADFVRENARRKAEDVAGRIRNGIVVGADSVVYLGKKRIIGKPRTLKHAKRILKLLFSQPHWVYTGIAVKDAGAGRIMVDYEKTKIYMARLSDAEIDRYHAKMHPLDKAGGFDIEGRGGIFIRRIEGCYTNVIGLPMAKLRIMLKNFGIYLL